MSAEILKNNPEVKVLFNYHLSLIINIKTLTFYYVIFKKGDFYGLKKKEERCYRGVCQRGICL